MDEFYVAWKCDSCGAVVGFWKPGNPSGSTPTATEEALPESIQDYVGHACVTLE